MTRLIFRAGAIILFFSRPSWADLSFLQVLQAQTGLGQEGIFGKTWVELSGRKMRLVSGYATRISAGKYPEEPRRIIQIIDLDKSSRILVFPENKTYSRAPLGAVDYDNRLHSSLSREGGVRRLEIHGAELSREKSTRELLGANCEHWRLRVRVSVHSPTDGPRPAVMEQNLWLAPLSGPLMATALDLIAFENDYRKTSGSPISPLDFERYQVREAAAFLRVRPSELAGVAARARAELRELPSFPLASSVSWWSPEEDEAAPKPPEPEEALKSSLREGKIGTAQIPAYARPGARQRVRVESYARPLRFKVINWRRSERLIDRMYFRTRDQIGTAISPGTPQEARPTIRRAPVFEPVYPRFERGMRQAVDSLSPPAARSKSKPAPSRPPSGPRAVKAPFYEVYAELHGLESLTEVAPEDFSLPNGYREVPYAP